MCGSSWELPGREKVTLGQEPLAGGPHGPAKMAIYQLGPEKIRDELFNLGLSFLNTQP